jgi:hypothetical protein
MLYLTLFLLKSHCGGSHKEGYDAYAKWKFEWGGCCQREASTKTYVAEMVMAFWVKCDKCCKWRTLPRTEGDLTPELSKTWICKPFTTGKKVIQYLISFKLT